MCGVVGIWNLDGRPVDREALLRARERMVARGPDDAGLWIDGAVGLAHRRLSILDLSERGRQPMADPAGRRRIVYNGEVYNFTELREQLEGRGYVFATRTDTEVLVHGFDAWGEQLFERLIGMFALGLWDADTRRLTLARGPMGKKPLFVHHRPGRLLAFASTLAPLVELPGVAREVDQEALHDYLRFGYAPSPRSLLAHTEKLNPGEWRSYGPDGPPTARRYFDLAARVTGAGRRLDGDETARLDELEELLLDATRRRMVADVPLGAFLSGGVDSSLVTALMRRAAPGRVRTFSIGFDRSPFDETEHAARVARELGVENTVLRMSVDDMLGFLGRFVEWYDEPIADESAFPTLAVAKLAREHVTVVLTGDGGDEPFGGYGSYRTARVAERYYGLAPRALRGWVSSLGRRLPDRRWAVLFEQTAAADRYLFCARYSRLDRAVEPGHLAAIPLAAPDGPVAATLRGYDGLELHERMQLHHCLHRMIDAIETKVDRATMAFSLEARCPLLDHRVVETAFRLPSRMKIRGGTRKWALRALLARHLPRRLFERPKQGFQPPMAHWLRGPLEDLVAETLGPAALKRRGLLDPQAVGEVVERHRLGRADHTRLIWGLVALELWWQRYLDPAPVRATT